MEQIFSESKKNYTLGFTLVEMLVVIIIITILSSLFVVNYKNIQNQLALERAAFGLANNIRRAQEMAMSAAEQGDRCRPPGPTEFRYSFGISLSTSSNCSQLTAPCKSRYILFTDCNDNNSYQWNPDDDYIIDLPDFSIVQVSSLTGFAGDVIFMPPDPTVLFDNNGAIIQVSIVLSRKDDITKTKTITVNKAGLVDIQ